MLVDATSQRKRARSPATENRPRARADLDGRAPLDRGQCSLRRGPLVREPRTPDLRGLQTRAEEAVEKVTMKKLTGAWLVAMAKQMHVDDLDLPPIGRVQPKTLAISGVSNIAKDSAMSKKDDPHS